VGAIDRLYTRWLDGTCAIGSETSVSITTQFIEGLKKAGPPDWTNQRWYEPAMSARSKNKRKAWRFMV
jgi:hypothetical protein